MLELYHHGSSVCAAKVRIVLEEKGLDYEKHYIDILAGDRQCQINASGLKESSNVGYQAAS
jgi:glutathione S-transferase